jgi:hypothetical protein
LSLAETSYFLKHGCIFSSVILSDLEQRNLNEELQINASAVSEDRSRSVLSPRSQSHTRCCWQLGSKLWIWSNLPIGIIIRHSNEADLPPGVRFKVVGWPWQYDVILGNRKMAYGNNKRLRWRLLALPGLSIV